MDEDIIFW